MFRFIKWKSHQIAPASRSALGQVGQAPTIPRDIVTILPQPNCLNFSGFTVIPGDFRIQYHVCYAHTPIEVSKQNELLSLLLYTKVLTTFMRTARMSVLK